MKNGVDNHSQEEYIREVPPLSPPSSPSFLPTGERGFPFPPVSATFTICPSCYHLSFTQLFMEVPDYCCEDCGPVYICPVCEEWVDVFSQTYDIKYKFYVTKK